jgi:hypothetical protein
LAGQGIASRRGPAAHVATRVTKVHIMFLSPKKRPRKEGVNISPIMDVHATPAIVPGRFMSEYISTKTSALAGPGTGRRMSTANNK